MFDAIGKIERTSELSYVLQQGRARVFEGVSNNPTSAARLLTSPSKTFPPANLHFGNSSAATVSGFSPAFNLLIKVDDSMFPQPSLNVQDASAPNWLLFNLMLDLIALSRQDVNCFKSDMSRVVAVASVNGNFPASEQVLVLQRWP